MPRIFNNFFTKTGPKLTNEIETFTIKFDDYLEQCNAILPDNPVSINELKKSIFSSSDKEENDGMVMMA